MHACMHTCVNLDPSRSTLAELATSANTIRAIIQCTYASMHEIHAHVPWHASMNAKFNHNQITGNRSFTLQKNFTTSK